MKFKEFKKHHESGYLECHYYEDENGFKCGEQRLYRSDGSLWVHSLARDGISFGEQMSFGNDGEILERYLHFNCKTMAKVISCGNPATHSEEELIEIAKEHNLPLLSELPKTDAELTHWNLKYPHLPCLPIES